MAVCACVKRVESEPFQIAAFCIFVCNISYVNAFYACCLLFGADFGNGAFVYFLLYWVMNVGNYYRFRSPRLSAFAWNAAISIHILSTISDAHSHTHSAQLFHNVHYRFCKQSTPKNLCLLDERINFTGFITWTLSMVLASEECVLALSRGFMYMLMMLSRFKLSYAPMLKENEIFINFKIVKSSYTRDATCNS